MNTKWSNLRREYEERYNAMASADNYERLDCFVEFMKEVLQPILNDDEQDEDVVYDFGERIRTNLCGLAGTLAIEYEMAKAKAALNRLPKPKDMTDDELKKEMGDESRRYIMAFRGYDSLHSAMINLSDTLYLQRNKYHEWSDIQMRHADLELELMDRRLEAMRKKRGY